MSAFFCCIWWFVFGVLVGWLLAWWLGRCSHAKPRGSDQGGAGTAKQGFAGESVPHKPVVSRAEMIKAAEAAGISFKNAKNDLEVIEGIGPKIAVLLNESGIHTFDDLGRASIASLNAALEKGGARYRLANPSTWAEQARLAAEGKWTALKALQKSLNAGIR